MCLQITALYFLEVSGFLFLPVWITDNHVSQTVTQEPKMKTLRARTSGESKQKMEIQVVKEIVTNCYKTVGNF